MPEPVVRRKDTSPSPSRVRRVPSLSPLRAERDVNFGPPPQCSIEIYEVAAAQADADAAAAAADADAAYFA